MSSEPLTAEQERDLRRTVDSPDAYRWELNGGHVEVRAMLRKLLATIDALRAAASEEPRPRSLREAAENVAAHHNGEPGHDMNDRCWPTLYRILTRAALHSGALIVKEPTK